MKVFGSYAKQVATPKDIDVVVEFSASSTNDEQAELSRLLSLSRQYYGALDLFVKQPGFPLLVRNDLATGWQKAKNAKALNVAMETDGICLNDISWPAPKTRSFSTR